MEEIDQLESLEGSDIRKAKQVLAFEATRISHGEEEAQKAQSAAAAAFGVGTEKTEQDIQAMPTTVISRARLAEGVSPMEIFSEVGLTSSRGEARRLIKQGGLYVNDQKVDSLDDVINEESLTPDGILLRTGKKKYHRLIVE